MERAVLIGGGGGLPIIFIGMRAVVGFLTGVMAVTDFGRHTGVVRKNRKVLAPGDVRNAILTVAPNHRLLAEILQHRSTDGSNLGNLVLALGAELNHGSMEKVIEELNDIFLPSNERIWPIATEPYDLHIQGYDEAGSFYFGEEEVRRPDKPKIIRLELNRPSGIYLKSKQAIEGSDQTIIPPGSLLSTKGANLLILGVPQAMSRSRQRVLMLNNTTQPGQTDDHTPFDEVKFLIDLAGKGIIQVVLGNSAEPNADVLRELEKLGRRYLRITPDEKERIESLGVRVYLKDIIVPSPVDKEEWNKENAVIYHDPYASAMALWEIYQDFERARVTYSLPEA